MIQREMLEYKVLLRLLEPIIKGFLGKQLNSQIEEIKTVIVRGYPVNLEDRDLNL